MGHLHLQAELGREPSLIQQKFTATVAAAYQHFDDQHGKARFFAQVQFQAFFAQSVPQMQSKAESGVGV